jgi:hypothetical protein
MNKDREIVYYMLREVRKSKRRFVKAKNAGFNEDIVTLYYQDYITSHNMAELARRILYDQSL